MGRSRHRNAKRPLWLTLALLATMLMTVAALVSGADWLLWRTPFFGIPAGNLMAWAGFMAAASLPLSGAPGPPMLRPISLAALLLAILWLPISVALAGNVDHVFNVAGPARFRIWLTYTFALLALLVGLLTAYALLTLTARMSTGRPAAHPRKESRGLRAVD